MKKLTHDLETKIAQRDEMQEMQRMQEEGIPLDNDGGNEFEHEDTDMELEGPEQGMPDMGQPMPMPMPMEMPMEMQMQMQMDEL